MSIRAKLIVAYIMMVIISGSVIVIASITFPAIIFEKMLPNNKDYEDSNDAVRQIILISGRVDYALNNQPEMLIDQTYIEELDAALNKHGGSISIEIDDTFTYVSTNYGSIDLVSILKTYDYSKKHNNLYKKRIKGLEEKLFLRYPIETSQGKGFAYIGADTSRMSFYVRHYVSGMFFVILIVAFVMLLLLYIIISYAIIKPLKKLEEGTNRIKDGDLNFEIKNESNDELGKVCFSFDRMRRELKHSIDKQLQYEDSRKELITSISHDLKTPITSIKGYVEGILDGVADTDEKINEYLQVIYAKSKDMDSLIDDLFLFSKLDLDKLPFHYESLSAKRYLIDCIEEIKYEAVSHAIDFSFSYVIDDATTIYIDPMQIKRTLLNIVQNAIKYMDKEEKRIIIKGEEVGDELLIAIQDNGKGIKQQELLEIFERFYRCDQSRNTKVGGSGLGLAIAKQIIEQHRGRIWAESIYGKGTTIYIALQKEAKKA